MQHYLVMQAVRARFQLPLGAIAHPFADPPEGSPLPVIQLENYGIIRCRRCRTYINPFMVWSEDGRSVINPELCSKVTILDMYEHPPVHGVGRGRRISAISAKS